MNPNKTTVDFYRDTADFTYNLIENSDLLITDRYHAGVMAVSAGTKVVTMADTWKLREFQGVVDWNKLCENPLQYYQSLSKIVFNKEFVGIPEILNVINNYLIRTFNYKKISGDKYE
jgi:polysaccharide pyruvyl transferase WcaK-like protein